MIWLIVTLWAATWVATTFVFAHCVVTLQRHALDHAMCSNYIRTAVTAAFKAQILREAADRWESPRGQADARRISLSYYTPDGPPVPSLWLREWADAEDAELEELIDEAS